MAAYFEVPPPVLDWQLKSSGIFSKNAKRCDKKLLDSKWIYRTYIRLIEHSYFPIIASFMA